MDYYINTIKTITNHKNWEILLSKHPNLYNYIMTYNILLNDNSKKDYISSLFDDIINLILTHIDEEQLNNIIKINDNNLNQKLIDLSLNKDKYSLNEYNNIKNNIIDYLGISFKCNYDDDIIKEKFNLFDIECKDEYIKIIKEKKDLIEDLKLNFYDEFHKNEINYISYINSKKDYIINNFNDNFFEELGNKMIDNLSI